MQAAGQQSISEQKRRALPHVVAVASGKGGVGKSSIAVNLGLALARTGARTCILDADTGLANVNILLRLQPRFSLEHVVFGAKAIEDVTMDAPHGLKVMPGANGISECVNLLPRQQLRLARELARVEPDFDYLLLDMAAGVADSTLDMICSAHQVVLVITPEPTSLTDAYSLIKLLQRRRAMQYFVVVNMCDNATQASAVFQRFGAAVETYIGIRIQFLGCVPRDDAMRAAVKAQRPLALLPADDPSCRPFSELADSLRRTLAAYPPRVSFANYWERRFRHQQGDTLRRTNGKPARHLDAVDDAEDLRGMQDRLLSQVRRPDTSPEAFGEFLHRLNEAYLERLADPAADPDALSRWLTDHAERIEKVMPGFARRLSVGSFEQADPPSPALPPAASMGKTDAVKTSAPVSCGSYDERRFGSQQALLALLRRQGDDGMSVRELIDALC